MFRNYLKTAYRNLIKGGIFSIINLSGLAIGMAVAILLLLFVKDELSFDQFHEDSNRIYRAWVKEHYEGKVFFNTVTPIILGQELRDNIPEIRQVARYTKSNFLVKKGDFSEQEEVHLVEPEFLQLFHFPLLRGKAGQVLKDIHQVVVTEEMGIKYFGDANPLGQVLTLQVNGEWADFTVSGVIEKAPGNSSIQYGFLIPFGNTKELFPERARASWTNVAVETYILLDERQDAGSLEAKVASFIDGKLGEDYKPGEYQVGFQPLADIHLNNAFPLGLVPVSDGNYPNILAGVALLILLLAAINFTTIAIGRSALRAREVGVRKAAGASRGQLMAQFWSEAFLAATISVAAGALLVQLALPFFNALAEKHLVFGPSLFHFLGCLALVGFMGLLSGAYPAVVLSGFSPIRSLRGLVTRMGSDKHLVLRGLVGFQFLLSILLIACTLVMAKQLHFLQNKNLGFDQEQVVVLPYSDSGLGLTELLAEGQRVTERLRNELDGKPSFKDAAWSNHTFGTAGWLKLGYREEQTNVYREFHLNGIGSHFLPLMGIRLAEGHNPDPSRNAADARAVVVNGAYARAYGVRIGQPLPKPFQEYKVAGIAEDFNFQSLHSNIQPLVLAPDPIGLLREASDVGGADSFNPKISVKISGDNLPATIAELRKAWQKVAPEQPFNYAFLDETIGRQYRAERRFSEVVSYSTALAVLIACLGLLGIATLGIAQRTKEIGIRKALGATTGNIVWILSKNFTLLVGLAALFAMPLAWYFMSNWLEDFAYRVAVSPLTLGLAGLIALALSWLIVGWQSARAALGKPIDALRSE